MHGLFIVEQAFFQHTGQRGGHARRCRFGHQQKVPADVGRRQCQHNGIGLGQQRAGGQSQRPGLTTVSAEHVLPLGRQAQTGRRLIASGTRAQAFAWGKLDDEQGHQISMPETGVGAAFGATVILTFNCVCPPPASTG